MRKVQPNKEDFVGPYTYLMNWEELNISQNWNQMFEFAYEQLDREEYIGLEEV